MPLHHTLLLPSSDRNPLTFESPLEKFDNLSRNRTKRETDDFIIGFFLSTHLNYINIGLRPPTKHSTAITIRINPIKRIITLLPVSPMSLTNRVDKRKTI